MAWLDGWKYRKSIVIAHTADGAQTNYQMKLLVGESSGATGEDIDCGGLVASDFDDLRFTTQSGAYIDENHPHGECDYWIESLSGSTPNQLATVWIEVPSIDAHPNDTTIYLYYGGETTAASNGANTFPFFDHFDGDLSKWSGDTASASIASSIVSIAGTGSAWKRIFGNVTAPATTALRFYARLVNANYLQVGLLDTDLTDYALVNYSGGTLLSPMSGGTPGTATSSNWTVNEWKTWDLLHRSNVNTRLIENGSERTGSPNVNRPFTATDTRAQLANYATTASNVQCDWILLRNYTYNEPTWSSFGAQESFYLNRLSPYVHILAH